MRMRRKITDFLAPMEMEILNEETLLFSGRKERPKQAPFVTRK
jgi:hypothetical protein